MNSSRCISAFTGLSMVLLLLGYCRCDNAFLRQIFQTRGGDVVIMKLQEQVRDLEHYIHELQKEIYAEKAALEHATDSAQRSSPSASKRFIDPFSDHILYAYRQKGAEVGFHAALQASTDLTIGQTLKFDSVLANIGSSFDPGSSTFIVPSAGTYLLTINVVCNTGSTMHLAIMQNSVPIFNSLCDNHSGESWTQGGGTTIMPLNYRDRINVGMIWPKGSVASAYGNGMTTFSGYLLKQH